MVMANPDFQYPRGWNNGIARIILSEIFYRIRDFRGGSPPTYQDIITELQTLFGELGIVDVPDEQINVQVVLMNIVGQKDPTKWEGQGGKFIERYFGRDTKIRKTFFEGRGIPTDIINGLRRGIRLLIKLNKERTLYIIGFTNSENPNNPATPAYHLTVPTNPCALAGTREEWKQHTVHFKDEPTNTYQYYKINDLSTEVTSQTPVREDECGGGGSSSTTGTGTAPTRQGQGQGIGPSARSGPQQNVSITTGKYAGTYTFSCKGMDGSKPVNLYTRDGGTSDLYIVFKQAGKWFANPTTLTCGGGGSSANPNPGGKRRRSTRRRRALRKTRKAYI
jgi:hypothetical protein